MKRSRPIAALVVLAGSVVAPSGALADFDRHCEERPLDAAERASAERVVAAFRTALPSAPAGWTVDKDGERVSAVACEAPGTVWRPGGKLFPQPVSIHVYREYRATGATPPPTAQAAPAAAKTASAADPARRKELEARLAELQRDRKDAGAAYQEARRTGDRAGQEAARRRDREVALAMRPVQEELSTLRRSEAAGRAAELDAHTAAAVAHDRAVEEARRDARVEITANAAAVQFRKADAMDPAGADLALRKSGGLVLLLGPWSFAPGDTLARATMDASAPRARVQTVAVEISGSPTAATALHEKVGLAALRGVAGR